jgi:hypothetical protein
MADDKKLAASGGMNDITSLMHNQGLSDLSWLAVDEKTYREFEALPKQNLDMIPELQKAVSMQDGVPHVAPLRPHTIVNQNPSDTLAVSGVDLTTPIRNRVAHLVMAGMAPEQIPARLSLEFAHGDIVLAADAIREVLAERGVLGNVYVDAKHFPRAAFDKKERKLARDLSKNALYVVGGCGGSGNCNCHENGICATFGGKRVVAEVPWGSKLAAHYAPRLASEFRPLDFSEMPKSGAEWKERMRAAFLKAPVAKNPDGYQTTETRLPPKPVQVTKADVEAFWARRQVASTTEPMPSATYMKYARRMMEGHDDTSLLIASGNPELASLASEYGLLGHSYVDVDALGGCRQALALIKKMGSATPDFAVRRSATCEHCRCAEDGACAQISQVSAIVDRRPGFDIRAFARSLVRGVSRGQISMEQARVAAANAKKLASPSWTVLTAKMNLFVPPKAPVKQYAGPKVKAHHGAPARETDRVVLNPEEVRKSVSHLMNTGLSGHALASAVLSRYNRQDLQQVPEVGKRLATEDGIQGTFFIDPTAYPDYGRGCNAGSKLFRKKEGSAPYVLTASGCTGCTLQTAPGWCSKYAKELIRQVPTQVRKASIEARKKLPVVQPVAENPVEKWELASEVTVDPQVKQNLGPEIRIPGASIGD